MFFCEGCRALRQWPASLMRSRGPCEVCGKTADCYEVRSDLLPLRHSRARCPYCGRKKALKLNGTIWSHRQKGSALKCGGSGQRPVA